MLSILYVDDERDLLEIGKLFLERHPDLRVDTHISAKEALASPKVGKYDAIVSDYQMPEMDGIEFLKTVREKYGDVPFILFTGRGREEIVIQAINNGVDFYLQKGGDVRAQFAELAHKIRQAVARRKAEISLIESEKRLADIINFLPDATFAINRDGIIIAWNRAIEEMTGLPADKILGKGDYEYALPFYGERRPILIDLIFEPDEVIEQKYSHIIRQKDILIADTTLPILKGKEVTLVGKASPLYNSQGEIVGAIEAIRDITLQKSGEDELRAAYEQITASEEELRDQLDVLEESEKKIRESEARLRYMIGFYEKAKDPEQELLGYAVEGAGAVTESPLGYLAFLNDDESELSMYAWSRSAMEECAIRDKPIVYKTANTGLWGEAVRQRHAVITNDYAAPHPAKKGYPPGHPGIVRHMNVPIMDGGHIVLVAGVANKPADYTETDVQELQLLMQSLWLVIKRRRIEGALLESEEKYRDLFENSVIGIFRTTTEGNFLAINTTFARIAGYDSPQQMMEAIRDVRTQLYVKTEDHDRFVNALKTDGFVKDFAVQYHHRDGHAIWIQINARVVRDAQGDVRYYEGTIEDISEQKNDKDALLREKIFSNAVLESIPGLLYLYDSDGNLVRWNKSHETVSGYTAEELGRMHLLDWFKGDDDAIRIISEGVGRALKEGQSSASANLLTKSGKRIPFFFTAKRLEIEGKTYFTGVGIDITDRQRAQDELRSANEQLSASQEELQGQLDELVASERRIRESEVKYRELAELLPQMVFEMDPGFRVTYANRYALSALGLTEQDLAQGFFALSCIDPGQHERIRQAIENLIAGTPESNPEYTAIRQDGTTFPVLIYTAPVYYGEALVGFRGVVIDISDRKKAENALRESAAMLASIFRAAPVGIGVVSDRVLLNVNDQLCEMTGYSAEQLIGKSARILYPDEGEFERVGREKYEQIRKSGSGTVETRWQRKDGAVRDILLSSTPLDPENHAAGVTFTALDITDSKQAEEALKESEERYRNIIELLPLGMHFYELLPDGPLIFTGSNPAADTILGIDNSSFIGKTIEDAFPGLVGTEIPDQYRKVAADGGVWHTDQVIYDRGEIRGAFAVQAFQIRQNAMVTVFYNITKRKQAEEALKESEEKYRTILENIQDVYYRSDAVGNLIMASPSMTGLLGYEHLDELIGKNIAGDIWLYPDRREAFIGDIKKQGFVKNYEVILKRKDGSPVTVATSSHFHYDRKGGIAGVEGIFHDITAIRNADQQINLLAALIDISPVSVTVHDADGRFLYANQRTFDLHGYTREEFMGLNLHQLDVPVSEELINERIQVLKQKGEISFDVEHLRKDGSRFPLHVTAKITHWNDREVILSVATDLSDRMEAERILFESEERLQLALAGADLGTWNWNIETGEVAFNERWAGMLGYTLDEIEPDVKSWELLVHPDDMPRVQEILAAHLEGRTDFYECEHRMRHKDGSWIWVLDKGRVIQRDTVGWPQLAAGTHLDITARKLAEEELRQSEALYRTVIENIQDAFIRTDREGCIVMANPSAATMLGFDKPEDLIGKPVSGFYRPPEFRQVLLDKMIKHGKIVDQTIELQRKDGTVFWGSANFHCLYDAHGEMDGVEGSLHDITEYRAMERAVSEANHKLNLLNSMTRHDVTNQLTALQGFAQIAAMKKGDLVMADYLAKILAAADTIARQIEFTRTYQELGMKAPAWTTVEVVIARVESRVPVKFSGTCRGIEILADPMLERVFFNLFDNAVRHGVRVTAITVRCEREPDGILVIVEDNGTGVPGAEKEKIFERGVGKNTGLGLFLVREILSITHISIKETGVYGKGARFEISVPEGMYRFVKP